MHVKLEDFSQVMRESPAVNTGGGGSAQTGTSLLKLCKVEDAVAKETEDGLPVVRLPETPKKFEGKQANLPPSSPCSQNNPMPSPQPHVTATSSPSPQQVTQPPSTSSQVAQEKDENSQWLIKSAVKYLLTSAQSSEVLKNEDLQNSIELNDDDPAELKLIEAFLDKIGEETLQFSYCRLCECILHEGPLPVVLGTGSAVAPDEASPQEARGIPANISVDVDKSEPLTASTGPADLTLLAPPMLGAPLTPCSQGN